MVDEMFQKVHEFRAEQDRLFYGPVSSVWVVISPQQRREIIRHQSTGYDRPEFGRYQYSPTSESMMGIPVHVEDESVSLDGWLFKDCCLDLRGVK